MIFKFDNVSGRATNLAHQLWEDGFAFHAALHFYLLILQYPPLARHTGIAPELCRMEAWFQYVTVIDSMASTMTEEQQYASDASFVLTSMNLSND